MKFQNALRKAFLMISPKINNEGKGETELTQGFKNP